MALSRVTIVTAIHNIKSNKGAKTAGIDRKVIDDYLQADTEDLIEEIQETGRKYEATPVRRVYIEKSNGKKRPLGIASIKDRIIQECLRIVIEPILEAKFYPHSYGFRPYRACKHAVTNIVCLLNSRAKIKSVYAIEGDIKGYFDNINHRILLQKLWKAGVHDKRVITIINLMLKAGYIEAELQQTQMGTPQGGILSPLLANLYLNSFDWLIGRMYQEPKKRLCSKVGNDRRRLSSKGVIPKYLTRYADDWVIQTNKEEEAKRLLKWLIKYFKHRLKLELSEEKTVITNMMIKPIRFLGFEIRAGKPRGTPERPNPQSIVGKPYPDRNKVKLQIKKVNKEIKRLERLNLEAERAKQINRVNAVIIGIGEYWKTSICKDVFDKMDYIFNYRMYKTFRKIYKDDYQSHKIPVKMLSNLTKRHKDRTTKTYGIQVGKRRRWIGITILSITPSKWEKKPYNQDMSPYTKEGRRLYIVRDGKTRSLPLNRPVIDEIISVDTIGNDFEYHMNREYAYNRDVGKCRICKEKLIPGRRHCHKISERLPANMLNKVINLAWVCNNCHEYIHGRTVPKKTKKKIKDRIEKFSSKLNIRTV